MEKTPKNVQKRYRNGAKIEKNQNWPGDLGADFRDLAFLKLFEEKGDFWRPAERPKKSGSARKWAKIFNAATFGSPRASPERPKRPQRASRGGISKEI